MPQIIVTDTNGSEHEIAIKPGNTLMQLITDAGVSDLLALCGGVCSCATCHVYVDEEFADKLPPVGEDELSLLETTDCFRDSSRLSCQIRVDDSLDGMKVTVAPAE